MFNAILITRPEGDASSAALTNLPDDALPDGDVTVDVEYSTLNYKDALAITARSPVVRTFPMVPGIDFAGVVAASRDERYQTGDRVLLNGWGVGETHWGGLAQKARVKGDWLLPVPSSMTTRATMSVGTAGYTAMLCVMALERAGIRPGAGSVLVTGANGGVGTFAVWLLAQRGYEVIASTGRPSESAHLHALGAQQIVDRSEFDKPGKPLQKERWAAAVDCVGSHTLANVCAGTRYGGAVAACGLAQGMDFPASVTPFILRNVSLLGIDSVQAPREVRMAAWGGLAEAVTQAMLDSNTATLDLTEVVSSAAALLRGEIRGRVVVDVNR